MTLVLLFVPITLIFGVLVTLRSVRALRSEAARLQASVDAMRKAFLSGQSQIDPAMQPSVARKLDEIAQQTQQTQAALANIAAKVGKGADAGRAGARGVPTPKALMPPEEPALALGAQPDPAGLPLTVDEFIRAMNFPDGPDDTEGFAAMRAALSNRDIAKLIRAAQTLLKMLAQDGIYMDDLKHDPAAPNAWRLFAKGERGRAVAALGGVRDRSALALSVGRLRNDPVYRDAAHHFLRAFDRCLTEFEPSAEDADLAALAGTRTARAFMLLGRVLGTFD
jgi:enamine deaminase RidA (YjgF/YER057c/UK114 family)